MPTIVFHLSYLWKAIILISWMGVVLLGQVAQAAKENVLVVDYMAGQLPLAFPEGEEHVKAEELAERLRRIAAGGKVDEQDKTGTTALMLAVELQHRLAQDYLLLHKASPTLTRVDGKNALDLAQSEEQRRILKWCAWQDEGLPAQEKAKFVAQWGGWGEYIADIISGEVNPNQEQGEMTPLVKVVREGTGFPADTALLLLRAGADPQKEFFVWGKKWTSLSYIAKEGTRRSGFRSYGAFSMDVCRLVSMLAIKTGSLSLEPLQLWCYYESVLKARWNPVRYGRACTIESLLLKAGPDPRSKAYASGMLSGDEKTFQLRTFLLNGDTRKCYQAEERFITSAPCLMFHSTKLMLNILENNKRWFLRLSDDDARQIGLWMAAYPDPRVFGIIQSNAPVFKRLRELCQGRRQVFGQETAGDRDHLLFFRLVELQFLVAVTADDYVARDAISYLPYQALASLAKGQIGSSYYDPANWCLAAVAGDKKSLKTLIKNYQAALKNPKAEKVPQFGLILQSPLDGETARLIAQSGIVDKDKMKPEKELHAMEYLVRAGKADVVEEWNKIGFPLQQELLLYARDEKTIQKLLQLGLSANGVDDGRTESLPPLGELIFKDKTHGPECLPEVVAALIRAGADTQWRYPTSPRSSSSLAEGAKERLAKLEGEGNLGTRSDIEGSRAMAEKWRQVIAMLEDPEQARTVQDTAPQAKKVKKKKKAPSP